MNSLEIIGVILTLACIWMTIREHASGWLLTIASCAIYAYISLKARLYSNVELQLIYIGISLYGFFLWHKGLQPGKISITLAPGSLFLRCIILSLLLGFVLGYIHSTYTDSALTWLDAMIAAMCIVAQWMMARKYFQCWYLWIAANLGYLVLYAQASLWLTWLLYIVILFLNIYGYWRWRKAITTSAVASLKNTSNSLPATFNDL